MRKINFIGIVLVCFACVSCSGKDAAVTQPPVVAQTEVKPKPVKHLTPIQNIQNIVITDELCVAAKNKDAVAELQVATYYDSLIKQESLGQKDVTSSQKAMVAAMYWYDIAIHYGGTNPQGKDRRRALSTITTNKEMTLYRRFSQNTKNPPCLPSEVFEGAWF